MGDFPTRILLATDGSEGAELAASRAAELARRTDSELHVVYVGFAPAFLMGDPGTVGYDRMLLEEIEDEARGLLRILRILAVARALPDVTDFAERSFHALRWTGQEQCRDPDGGGYGRPCARSATARLRVSRPSR